MSTELISWEVSVSGLVQGVYYRVFTRDAAVGLGVTGWVRNEPGGGVTALIQHHDEDVLSQLVAEMHRGPLAARVDSCQVREVELEESFTGFEIRHGDSWR